MTHPLAAEEFLQGCLCLDLETTTDGRILHLGAVLGTETVEAKGGDIRRVVPALEDMAARATFLVGHNILAHDLPVLQARGGHLDNLFRLPVVDTLLLSPLAFPENPYHALVKDYKLIRASVNDPVADARLSATLLADQWRRFEILRDSAPEVVAFFRFCFGRLPGHSGLEMLFDRLGGEAIAPEQAAEIFATVASDRACRTGAHAAADELLTHPESAPPLAYALAWLRVAGSNSVLPPWVRRRFSTVVPLLRQLRDLPCSDSACAYCHATHDPRTQLQRFFGFEAFRQKPEAADGRSQQEVIVEHGMRDLPLLAILPTGAGKSLCFQIPALARNTRRGVLTVVISPLQALMKDQVDNLTRLTGTPFAGAIYGMLTPPERGAMLEKIRLGDIAILYISPEQLRNTSVRNVLAQREIGSWVFDEAHCFSKWGHDFRPDYHYASRFIREFAREQELPVPPIACFTATAKADVREEILAHFRDELSQDLTVFDGGAERDNLGFEVQSVALSQKWELAHEILSDRLPDPALGSAVLYAATQKAAEEAANFLKLKNWRVEAYHAGLEAPDKRRIQEDFISGQTQLICATNAFGMGIDKDNVRLVLHLDIPGSLENYLQEAGRAGRDRNDADCVLLFDENDIETQFRLGASSRLSRKDIAQILRGLRSCKRNEAGDIVVTSGEILRNERVEVEFRSGDRGADTKVRTAIAVLEKAGFIERNENRTRVFQGSPSVKSLSEAEERIDALNLPPSTKRQWLAVLRLLMNAKSTEAVSTDSVAELPEFSTAPSIDPSQVSSQVLRTLAEMAEAGLIKKDLLLTAFVRHKVVNPARQTFEKVCALEADLLKLLRQEEPDPEGWLVLSLARVNQRLLDAGHACLPDTLLNLLKSIANDGRGLAGKQGSLELKYLSRGHQRVKLQRDWDALIATSEKRRTLAALALEVLLAKIPSDAPARADFLVEFAESDLHAALDDDLVLKQDVKDRQAAFEHALLFLHDQRVIILQQGLAVFRQAMTIRIRPEAQARRFSAGDYSALSQHYQERTFQVHVMQEYARLGLEKIQHALAFVSAYFTLSKEEFAQRYFAGKKEMLQRATGADSFRRIVDDLRNPIQQAIVAAKPDANRLILAGPGSGKTRLVAHRCAYLLRVERVPARGILVLCFNRHAAATLRRRVAELAGPDARGVTILTYHSLAMRLTGVSFADPLDQRRAEPPKFDDLIKNAVALLRGQSDVPGTEPDALRDRLLDGYRHILVDEYQDIDADQYDLVSAIAGRTQSDPDAKLSILAVGDDDQTIYSFRHANVEFIRRFEKDYDAERHFLVENYRSTAHIIDAANALISQNRDRMKTSHPIVPNKARLGDAPGGRWQTLDPFAAGRVQILDVANAHAQAAAFVFELQRMKSLSPAMEWRDCAVLASTRDELSPMRAALEACGIPVQAARDQEKLPAFFHIREIARCLDVLTAHRQELMRAEDLIAELDTLSAGNERNPWHALVREVAEEWREESGNAETPVSAALDYFSDALSQLRRDISFGPGVFLNTIHSSKGLEFPHVFITGGGWSRASSTQAREEERRVYYVGLTRARETLTLFQRADQRNPYLANLEGPSILRREPTLANGLPEDITTVRYELLTLEDVYMDFAQKHPANHPIHAHLRQLMPGSPLVPIHNPPRIELADASGFPVARLSSKACEVWASRLDRIRTIRVAAIIRRHLDKNDPEFAKYSRCQSWEVPVVEIVWS